MRKLSKPKNIKPDDIYSNSEECDGCKDCESSEDENAVTEEEEFTGIVSKLNVEDKSRGETFVCNMTVEERDKLVIDEEHQKQLNNGTYPSLSKRQKFINTCQTYHDVIDNLVSDITEEILVEIDKEQKSCPKGNQPEQMPLQLKEKEENWDNNMFMNLQKQTGQKWANLSRVCSSNVPKNQRDSTSLQKQEGTHSQHHQSREGSHQNPQGRYLLHGPHSRQGSSPGHHG